MISPIGIYLSVPFCKAKCSFCNFASDAFGGDRMDAYVDRLCAEIAGAKDEAERLGATLSRTVDSVYFGGGTPSLLSPVQFRRIFTALHNEFEVTDEAEMTLECAPGQLAGETLEALLRQGVNRMSLGVQSFVDHEARAIGRLHTRAICEAEIVRLRAEGIREIGIDLIVGLPYQTEASWRHSVECALNSGVTHVSVYMLEVDEESRLGREVLGGGKRYGAGSVPTEDEAAAWYEIACEMLDTGGVLQYEISNFAREGHASQHNLKYWRRQPYLGSGLDAHSMLPAGESAVRFQNVDDLDVYLNGATTGSFPLLSRSSDLKPDFLDKDEAFEESLFLGLRLIEGVCLDELRREFGEGRVAIVMPGMKEACEAGLLEIHENRVRLTMRGRMASNEVFNRLLVPAAV